MAEETTGEWLTLMGSNRHNYAKQVFDMYQKSYGSIGMHIKSADELIDKYKIWEVYFLGDKPIAFAMKSKTEHGIKGGVSGSDGSKEGKKAVVESFGSERPFHYTELSGRPREIALQKGLKAVPADEAKKILKEQGHDVEKLDEVTYRRLLRNIGLVDKTMFGQPAEKKFPKEYYALSKRKLVF